MRDAQVFLHFPTYAPTAYPSVSTKTLLLTTLQRLLVAVEYMNRAQGPMMDFFTQYPCVTKPKLKVLAIVLAPPCGLVISNLAMEVVLSESSWHMGHSHGTVTE